MSEPKRPSQHASANDLLSTKLTPPRLRAPIVSRERLLARLDQGLARRLTLLSAPPGSGKTTLVSEWLATRSTPVAWLSLDAGDNDPVRFWRYAITACRTFDAELGKPALAALRTSQTLSLEGVLTAFINELAQLPGPCVLVLEDYHAITSPEIHATVAFLVEHLPAPLHLIVITRTAPPLPLARLRTRNELNELAAADLRFSLEEISRFLQQTLRLSLPPEALARLEERTEGWVAALRLLALALEGKSDPGAVEHFLTTFSGEHRHVLEYLAGEVLAAQPAAVQTFLLQTSFLNRLTGALCDAVTGHNDGAQQLEQLERANLFLIALDSEAGQIWYRYHTLFAEALRHSARRRLGEAEVRAVYAQAGAWYAARGLWGEAIEATLAADQFAQAATLIEQFLGGRFLNEGYTLRRWIEALPLGVRHAHPVVCFNYAMALLFTSDRFAPATAAALDAPLRAAEATWRAERNDAALGEALALRSLVALWQDDLTRSFAFAKEALELLPEDNTNWRAISLFNVGYEELLSGESDSAQRLILEARALGEAAQNVYIALAATLVLGDLYDQQGELDLAVEHYRHVLDRATGREDLLDDQGQALAGLSIVAYERNDLATAEQQAARALEFGQRRSDEGIQVMAAVSLARVAGARGDVGQAQHQLQSLAARIRRRWLLREIQVWQARFALAAGDVTTAQHWQTLFTTPGEKVHHLQQEREELIAARIHLAQGKSETALKVLAGLQAEAHTQSRLRSELEILCLKALAHFAQDEAAPAQQALTRALTLAQAKGFRGTLLDEGESMAALLQATIPQLTKRPLAAYAAGLLREFAPHPTRPTAPLASPLLEPLSPQEQRVLRLLVSGLSNPEIARELVVSTNTVKTQVKSIYRKLNVNTREEAKQAAHELQLL